MNNSNNTNKEVLRIFVYGTLKPGECNFDSYCSGKVRSCQMASTKGVLYDIPLGYPAMVEEEGLTQGFLLEFDDQSALRKIDFLEGYDENLPLEKNLYTRKMVELLDSEQNSMGMAWTYFMTKERALSLNGIKNLQGVWNSQVSKDFNHKDHVRFLDELKK